MQSQFTLCGALAAAITIGISVPVQAQTPRIVGALSGFDALNTSPAAATGFGVSLKGMPKAYVLGTWTNAIFGAPAVYDIGTATAPNTLITYSSPTATLAVGGYTHFGYALPAYPAAGAVQRRWLHKEGTGVGPTDFSLPAHRAIIATGNVRDIITNETVAPSARIFWVLPYVNIVPGTVKLSDLKVDSPIVQGSIPLGGGADGKTPIRLDPGKTYSDDEPGNGQVVQSTVYSYRVYEDAVTHDGTVEKHAPGRQIAVVMDGSVTAPPEVQKVELKSLTLSPVSIVGGGSVSGRVSLSGPAPAGGIVVTLSSNNTSAPVPEKVTVPAGADGASFTIKTLPVTAKATAAISAAYGGITRGAELALLPAVQPVTLTALKLSVTAIKGGESLKGGVTLSSPAPAGGVVVTLLSASSFAVVPASVKVEAGATTGYFDISTKPVTAATVARIYAKLGDTARDASLTITTGK